MKTCEALFILAAIATAAPLCAEKVPLSQVPAPVQEAIRSHAGLIRIENVDRSSRNGRLTYEARWKSAGGAVQQMIVSEAGTILSDILAPDIGLAQQNLTLANKTGIALPETPPAVQTAIHDRIVDAPIDGIQKGIWNGQDIYEVTYHDNGRLNTFQITETGQPVVSQVPAINEAAATQGVEPATPTVPWQPRYSGLATANVPIEAGVKMAFHSAPRAVQDTVNHLANGARIEDFQRGLWHDQTVYEAFFLRNGRNVVLQILDDGTLLSSSPFGSDPYMSQQSPPTGFPSPVPTGAALPQPQHGPLNSQVGVPNTAAASTRPRFAGLADSNVQLEGSSRTSFGGAPSTVRRTVEQLANGARIEDFQVGNWDGQVVYEAAFRRNGQNIRLQVLDDGSVLTKGPGNATGAPPIDETGTVRE